jgi:hypothetical protein
MLLIRTVDIEKMERRVGICMGKVNTNAATGGISRDMGGLKRWLM